LARRKAELWNQYLASCGCQLTTDGSRRRQAILQTPAPVVEESRPNAGGQ
jgi:hypothetical protein